MLQQTEEHEHEAAVNSVRSPVTRVGCDKECFLAGDLQDKV